MILEPLRYRYTCDPAATVFYYAYYAYADEGRDGCADELDLRLRTPLSKLGSVWLLYEKSV
jgi:hypothetical protein